MSRHKKEKPPRGTGVLLAWGCEPLVGSACEKPLRGKQRNTPASPRAILFRRFALRRRKTAPVLRNGEPYPGKRAGVRTRSHKSRQRAGSRTFRHLGRRPGPHGGESLTTRGAFEGSLRAFRTGRSRFFTHAHGKQNPYTARGCPTSVLSSRGKRRRDFVRNQMADERRRRRRIKEREKRKEAERLRCVALRKILVLSQEAKAAAKASKAKAPDARPHQLPDGTWDVSATAGRFRT